MPVAAFLSGINSACGIGASAGEEGTRVVSLLPCLLWLLFVEKFLWLHVPVVVSVATYEIFLCPLNVIVGDKITRFSFSYFKVGRFNELRNSCQLYVVVFRRSFKTGHHIMWKAKTCRRR